MEKEIERAASNLKTTQKDLKELALILDSVIKYGREVLGQMEVRGTTAAHSMADLVQAAQGELTNIMQEELTFAVEELDEVLAAT